MGNDAHATAAAATCASCFTCKVPEVRALWLLVAMTYGCVQVTSKRSARTVEDGCLTGGIVVRARRAVRATGSASL